MPRLILASQSPRRHQLLEGLGFSFDIETRPVEETFPDDLPIQKVAAYLSQKKAAAFSLPDLEDKIIITADTVVILDQTILGKPANETEAADMLTRLSGKNHEVITGVTIRSSSQQHTFSDTTTVGFKKLTRAEINYYISRYQPFDKAGAYGAQEWMGMAAIDSLQGSYFNVMGLPVHKLYAALLSFGIKPPGL